MAHADEMACHMGWHYNTVPGVNILHYSQRKIWEKFPIFQRLGKSFLIIEFARHLSRKAKYAFFLVITITISGKRKIFFLICLQYSMGDGGDISLF